jgi:hypothetical protein
MTPIHIYAIGTEEQRAIKVGISRAPHARAETLQNERGIPLRVLVSTALPDRLSARAVEKMAHSLLAYARAGGEWFDVTETEALAAIEQAIEAVRNGAHAPDGIGTLVGVRLQPDLLARLDAYRGGKTRPQAIRELLEEYLK